MGGVRVIAIGASLGLLLQVSACAADLGRADGGYLHRQLGFRVADPAADDASWERVAVEGALVTLRASDGATMSLFTRCGLAPAEPRVRATGLWIGLERPRMVEQGPVSLGGTPAWRQRVDAELEGRETALLSVTGEVSDCSIDFVLVGPRAAVVAHEAVFEAWWRSYAPGAAS